MQSVYEAAGGRDGEAGALSGGTSAGGRQTGWCGLPVELAMHDVGHVGKTRRRTEFGVGEEVLPFRLGQAQA